MEYPYQCKECKKLFSVFKSVKDINELETCPDCKAVCDEHCRYIGRTTFYGADDWDKAEYNPAFGKIIKNRKHRDLEAKRRGMVEIGNENVENIHKASEQIQVDK